MTIATPHPAERPALGITLRILSGLLFAAMVVCIKAVSLDVPLKGLQSSPEIC